MEILSCKTPGWRKKKSGSTAGLQPHPVADVPSSYAQRVPPTQTQLQTHPGVVGRLDRHAGADHEGRLRALFILIAQQRGGTDRDASSRAPSTDVPNPFPC